PSRPQGEMSRARGGRLRRELGPFTATLFTAGMMVGIGIFATFGAATAAAGSGILVAILLGGSVALATGISAAQLGVNNPTEGGAFTWARDFDHPTLGFIAGCGYLGKNLVSMSVIALAFATYLGQVVPGLPTHVVAAAGVLAITGLNLFGIQLTSRVLIGLLAAIVRLLSLYGGASLHAAARGGAEGDGRTGHLDHPRRGDPRRARRDPGRPAQCLSRRAPDGQGARASRVAGEDSPTLAEPAPRGARPRSAECGRRSRLRPPATDRGRRLVHARLVLHHALRGAPAACPEEADLAA